MCRYFLTVVFSNNLKSLAFRKQKISFILKTNIQVRPALECILDDITEHPLTLKARSTFCNTAICFRLRQSPSVKLLIMLLLQYFNNLSHPISILRQAIDLEKTRAGNTIRPFSFLFWQWEQNWYVSPAIYMILWRTSVNNETREQSSTGECWQLTLYKEFRKQFLQQF